MRIDKYLKVSRILKRRSVANSACDTDRVSVNEKFVKPSHAIKIGDKVKIFFGNSELTFIIKDIKEKPSKDEASALYEVINE